MKDRTKFIGSSDIAVILGLSPYVTPIELWAEKIGAVPPTDKSEVEAVEWGTRLEKVVAKKFSEKHGVKLIAYKRRYVHPDYSFLSCELDDIIANTEELVECKTTSMWNYRDWADPEDVPSYYAAQVMWQLGISGRKVGHIAVLVGGQRYLEKKIVFDPKVFATMVSRAVKFWTEFVVPKTLPDMVTKDDADVLAKVYHDVQVGADVVLSDHANVFIEQIQALTRDKIALEADINRNKNELKAMLKHANEIKNLKFGRQVLDRMQKEYEIDIGK